MSYVPTIHYILGRIYNSFILTGVFNIFIIFACTCTLVVHAMITFTLDRDGKL